MTKEIIYITRYNQPLEELKQEVIGEYSEKCIICGSKKEIIITPILSEYPELSKENGTIYPYAVTATKD